MDREAEILSKLDQIIATQRIDGERQHAMEGDLRELKGQMSIMLTWLQSMDQRFSALMAPVNPPRKPAA
ncbi:hypothetical protein GBZ26_14250 [Azospirillum formosense]|uniref:SlyX protein n=1 Tax=Azospirillum formosense TaxID=861533 RepID=A0ABX2KUM7_9PROT|nr:hypothetical protein [Azospirillum formosense]MBY3753518.1 hypothetical protein [Azospirillum formosense]NUB20363.1 hypothetical protein [Azospirillum formosense]